jgi:hypothetical protein
VTTPDSTRSTMASVNISVDPRSRLFVRAIAVAAGWRRSQLRRPVRHDAATWPRSAPRRRR